MLAGSIVMRAPPIESKNKREGVNVVIALSKMFGARRSTDTQVRTPGKTAGSSQTVAADACEKSIEEDHIFQSQSF